MDEIEKAATRARDVWSLARISKVSVAELARHTGMNYKILLQKLGTGITCSERDALVYAIGEINGVI